ncbi:MAG: hypothetical protein H7Y12_01880 [Sphingobacteriaceae bacterium]|nr:hypothetical protein [Cytophagaceae bacterium]
MKKGQKLLLFFLVLAALSWGVYECKYRYSIYSDRRDRPWAYSDDVNAKLLLGTWQGQFRDPDGVSKTIRLTIVEPVTDEERAKKAARRRRKGLGSREDKRHFDGSAMVTSKLGTEAYELNGWVAEEDWHQLSKVHFQVADEAKRLRKNFGLGQGEGGRCQGDDLTLTLNFGYTTASGSGYSDSADPRYERKVPVRFSRVTP